MQLALLPTTGNPMTKCTMLFASIATLVTLTLDASGADKKRRVLLIDGENNHDWRSTTPIMKKGLEDTGRFTVDVATLGKTGEKPGNVTSIPVPPDVTKYDVVVSNYNDNRGTPWPSEVKKTLDENLKNGKIGLVIVHAAN